VSGNCPDKYRRAMENKREIKDKIRLVKAATWRYEHRRITKKELWEIYGQILEKKKNLRGEPQSLKDILGGVK